MSQFRCSLDYDCGDYTIATHCEMHAYSSDSYYCRCDQNPDLPLGEVFATSTAAACEGTAVACASGASFDFGGKESCEPYFIEYCASMCLRSIEVTPEASLTVMSGPLADCFEFDGYWECNCSSRLGYSAFLVHDPPSDWGTCERATPICYDAVPLERGAILGCEVADVLLPRAACELVVECQQEARLDSVPLTLNGLAHVTCEPGSGAQWDCSCVSGDSSVTFAFNDDEAPCQSAAEQCSQRLLSGEMEIALGSKVDNRSIE